MFEKDDNVEVPKILVNSFSELIKEFFPVVKMSTIVGDSLQESINAYTNKQWYFIINSLKDNLQNIYSDKEGIDEHTQKFIMKFLENEANETKRLYDIVRKISDDEKLEYLINLYTNLLTRQISYEMFINTLEFLETASTYEIAMAIKLYKKEKINDELGYLYIKKLVNHNLIEARWGVLNGPSVNPNEYELNEYGEKIISSLLSVKKYLE